MLFNDKQLSAVEKNRLENWIIGVLASEFEGHGLITLMLFCHDV